MIPDKIPIEATYSESKKIIEKQGVKIFIVDGLYIRNNLNIDWTMGGHWYVSKKYHFIPKDEIWIDKDLNAEDREATIYHELVEYELMKDSKWQYETAHELASEKELEFRNNSSELFKVNISSNINDKTESHTGNSNQIPGGKADNMNISNIAAMHNVSVQYASEQLFKGIKIEKEHTNDYSKAAEIALDHLYESIHYYTELEKMEEKLSAYELGRNAFLLGKKRIPSRDTELTSRTLARGTGNQESLQEFFDWIKGWNDENSKAPINIHVGHEVRKVIKTPNLD